MDAKDEIKRRLSVEEVIGDYLEMKRAGRNLKALSPFTSERTASFMVSPEKQIWHDFSSNKGGDIFSFIMEVEGVEFREALEILARKANVDLGQYRQGDGSAAKLKKRLLAAHGLAAQFYHLSLSKEPEALKYIKEVRGFTVDTIRVWKLGYAPEGGAALLRFLKKRGFAENELAKAGLITKRQSGWDDMFRGRLMVPLADGQGNTIGFTARLLKDIKNAPKYFNTPSTPIYDKSRQVFGLHLAKEAIRKTDRAILVEGNLDVIASHQAGVKNVVACAGTAMTIDHLRIISRLSPRVDLAFDTDEAGLSATERAIPIAQTAGIELGIVTLPSGAKDPDELIQKDPALWQKAAQESTDATTWTLQRYETLFDKTSAEGKRQLSTKALAVIRGLQDPVEREHHLKKLAALLDTSLSSLQEKLNNQKQTPSKKKPNKAVPAEPDKLVYEDHFLALNSFYPDVRDSLQAIKPEMLHTKRRRELLNALLKLAPGKRLSEAGGRQLQINEDYVKILALTVEERFDTFSPADITSEAMALARRIHAQYETKTKAHLTAAIQEAEANGDEALAAELLQQYQAILGEN